MYLTKLLHFILGRPSTEEENLVKRVTESSTRVSDHGLSGYRVESPITDWDQLEKELDMARDIVDNKDSVKDKDKDLLYKSCLLILMNSIEIKTRKIDNLIKDLENLK